LREECSSLDMIWSLQKLNFYSNHCVIYTVLFYQDKNELKRTLC
jgi:hypothetical protein